MTRTQIIATFWDSKNARKPESGDVLKDRNYFAEVLQQVEHELAAKRVAALVLPYGKRRRGIPIGMLAHAHHDLNCSIARLETARMLCDWFARGVQPCTMSWEQVERYL